MIASRPLNCCKHTHTHVVKHARNPTQWFTRFSSGAVSVNISPPLRALPEHPTDAHGVNQVSAFGYGSSALRCALSSTASPFGSTPSLQASVAASDTGSWALSSDSGGCLPTDEMPCSRSAPGGRSARKPLKNHKQAWLKIESGGIEDSPTVAFAPVRIRQSLSGALRF